MSFVPLIDWFSFAFTLLLIQVTMNAPPTAVLPPADAASAVTRWLYCTFAESALALTVTLPVTGR